MRCCHSLSHIELKELNTMLTGCEHTCRSSASVLVRETMQQVASKARLCVTPSLPKARSCFCAGSQRYPSATSCSIRLLRTCTSHSHQHTAAAPFGYHAVCPAWQQPAAVPRRLVTRASEHTAGPSAGLLSAVPFANSRQDADAAFESYHSTDHNFLLSK